jgi:hypothetical protein
MTQIVGIAVVNCGAAVPIPLIVWAHNDDTFVFAAAYLSRRDPPPAS